MIRTFHPIGQGAFVTEQFEQGSCIVYDCGTTTSKWLIRDLVERTFAQDERVDGVFISSVDFEHASGLEALLQRCQVRRVFLPYMTEEEKAFTLLKHLCEGGEADDFIGRLILNPKETLEEYRAPQQRHSVAALVAAETERDKNIFDVRVSVDLLPFKSIAGFRLYAEEAMDWVYVAGVYRQQRRIEKLREALADHGVDASCYETVEGLLESWAGLTLRKKLRSAYESLRLPFCAVSMAVYAGPEETEYSLYEQFTEEGKWSYYTRIRSGCLYTGNLQLSEADEREHLLQNLGQHMYQVGCWLVPGHGSQELYHEDILPKHNCIMVATADNENLTGEPHSSVIRSIMQRQIPFYLVTELPGSAVRFYVSETE